MANKNYRAGRYFEYHTRDIFEQNGHFVQRSAGSHGVLDLTAFPTGNYGKPFGIQVGRLKVDEFPDPTEGAKMFKAKISDFAQKFKEMKIGAIGLFIGFFTKGKRSITYVYEYAEGKIRFNKKLTELFMEL